MLADFLRSSEPLPTRSPHLNPHQSNSPFAVPGALLPLLRSRLCAMLALCTLSLVCMMSWMSGREQNGLFRLGKTPEPEPVVYFPPEGLEPSLWRELAARGLWQVELEPQNIAWTKPSSPQDPVPWTLGHLIPTRADNLARYRERKASGSLDDNVKLVNDEPVPRHRIDAFPRIPVVPEDAPLGKDLIFGFTTTVERAKQMSELWTRYLLPEGGNEDNRPACMILLSRDEVPSEIDELKIVLRNRGLKCGIKTSSHERYEVRVLSLTVELREYAKELGRHFKWFLFNDDDTFWLDQRTLRRMLSKYDPKEQWFVGATSEAKNQLDSFGRMAFGGAGMLISAQLMHDMHTMWDTCYAKFKNIFGGDEMVTRCAALAKGETKGTVTTEEKGLHQFDIPGDTTGVLQGGIPFLNLHHYLGGSWVHLFGYGSYRSDFSQIQLIKRVTEFLGGDNMFKRYVFGDGHWLFVNGYSITYYEEPLTRKMLSKMEHTWYEGYKLSFDDRPNIPERHDPNHQPCKQTFYIDDVVVHSPSVATFTYISADKWDEHLSREERVQLNVTWNGPMERA